MNPGLKLLLPVLFSIIVSGCEKDKGCQSANAAPEMNTGILYDDNSSSTYYKQAVASLKATEGRTYLAPYPACGQTSDCTISLIIQNTITKQITMNYKVTGSSPFGDFVYQGVISIAAGATVDVGQVSTQCMHLSTTKIMFESNNIVYL